MTTSYVGIGSNVGDRLAFARRAVAELRETSGIDVLKVSSIYETSPIGGPPQRSFVNLVVKLETELDARGLLEAAQAIETRLGREPSDIHWGPRVVDLDILTFGDEEIDEADLQVPHPRMHERGFVLVPLLELEADPKLPGRHTVATLRLGMSAIAGVRPYAPPLGVG